MSKPIDPKRTARRCLMCGQLNSWHTTELLAAHNEQLKAWKAKQKEQQKGRRLHERTQAKQSSATY